nr:immunoglobulin heavy chain junction region [Mus musculus]MBK4197607.1 immunoglobulin heavy chain junction region [Mus musculus]
CARTTRAMDYW